MTTFENFKNSVRENVALVREDTKKFLAKHTPLAVKGEGHEYELLNMFKSTKKMSWVPPVWGYIKNYSQKDFWMDLNCGITIGLIVIPQALSYSTVVGIPPFYGLYAAFLAKMPYVIFGTSPHVQIGPTAVVSLLVNSVVLKVFPGGYPKDLTPSSKSLVGLPPDQVDEAIAANKLAQQYVLHNIWLLAFFTGLFISFVGIFRVGFIVNFMSKTVLSGFISACGLIAASTQLRNFFGLKTKTNDQVWYDVMRYFDDNIGEVAFATSWLAITFLTILLTFEIISDNIPRLRLLKSFGPFIVVVMGALINGSPAIRLTHNYGIGEVGLIPSGLPHSKNPFTPLHGCLHPTVNKTVDNPAGVCTQTASYDYTLILTNAIIGALIGYLEQIAIGTSTSLRFDYRVDPNMEAISMGLACILCGLFQGFSVNGSLSRTVVAANVGGRTPLSSIYVFLVIMIVLVSLSKAVKDIPFFVLAAIVIYAAKGLFDHKMPIRLWRTSKPELLLWFSTFVLTLFLGIELGIFIAILLSLLRILAESAFPKITVLGYLPDDERVFKSLEKVHEAKVTPHVHFLRIDTPIHFANIGFVKEQIHSMLIRYNSVTPVKGSEPLRVFAFFKRQTDPGVVVEQNMTEMSVRGGEGEGAGAGTGARDEESRQNGQGLQRQETTIGIHKLHRIKFIVLDFSPVTSIDIGGVDGLMEMWNECVRNKVQLLFSNVNDNVLSTIEINGYADVFFKDHKPFHSNHEALLECRSKIDTKEDAGLSLPPPPANITEYGLGNSDAPAI